MRALGIDIGEDSIKIAEVVQNKKSVYVTAVYEKKLSQQVTAHDREIEAIEYVRSIAPKLDFGSARVVMALKQDKVTVRKKQFPFADRLKILKSLSFEMEEDIPFDPDLCLFDAKTILTEGLSAHVLAVAAPKTHIEKSLSLAKDFGVEPYTLTVDGIAFSNLLEAWDQAPPQYPTAQGPLSFNPDEDVPDVEETEGGTKIGSPITVTLNIGHKKTLLLAQIEGRLVFVRSLMWGSDYIIQEFVRKFQLPYLDAQRMLQNEAALLLSKSNQDFETANTASTIEKSMRDLVRDLQMSFLELQSEFHGEIKNVYLTGGLSLLPNVGSFLTQHLEVACNPVSVLDHLIDQGSIQTNNIPIEAVKSRFATAVGIAIEAFKKPKNPALQFMKGEFIAENNRLKQFWTDWGLAVKTAAAAVIVFFIWGSFRESMTTTLAEKGDEALSTQAKNVARLPRKQANEKGVKKYISENKKRAQEFKLLSQVASMNSALDVLKKISEVSPDKSQSKIDITQLQISDDNVKIVGYANSPREVTLLNQRLSTMALNKKVLEETPTLPSQPNRVAFSLSLKTDRGLLK
ncbi:pilus assembly protein PilM [Pseudobdellovibrio sp. HCB154]|uniref:pilus assembly protein PilM n=1 Tax=Pseudobdellovibrio sp. HCB154 TaxID=3386277 RepID=UPI003916EE1A